MRLFCSPFLQLLKSFFGFQQILFQTSFLNIEMKSQHKKFSTDKGKSMFACSSYIILSICLVAIAVIMSGSSAAINIIIALFHCSHILIYSIICYPSHPTFHKLSYHQPGFFSVSIKQSLSTTSSTQEKLFYSQNERGNVL